MGGGDAGSRRTVQPSDIKKQIIKALLSLAASLTHLRGAMPSGKAEGGKRDAKATNKDQEKEGDRRRLGRD